MRILGADVLDLSGDLEAITEDPDRAATLAVAADVYSVDERVRRFVSTSDRSRAEVALWGDVGALTEKVSAVDYRLSAAARAFKAHALFGGGDPRRFGRSDGSVVPLRCDRACAGGRQILR